MVFNGKGCSHYVWKILAKIYPWISAGIEVSNIESKQIRNSYSMASVFLLLYFFKNFLSANRTLKDINVYNECGYCDGYRLGFEIEYRNCLHRGSRRVHYASFESKRLPAPSALGAFNAGVDCCGINMRGRREEGG